jgi:FtsZ-binding cell division protein ZapB
MNTNEIMALVAKVRDARVYEWDVSEAVEANKTLQAAIEELVQERDSEIARHDSMVIYNDQLAAERDEWKARTEFSFGERDKLKVSRDEYQVEADRLAWENKTMRDALETILSIKFSNWSDGAMRATAREALTRSKS